MGHAEQAALSVSADLVAPEGDGGNYGSDSGGYDHLGLGSLTFSLT